MSILSNRYSYSAFRSLSFSRPRHVLAIVALLTLIIYFFKRTNTSDLRPKTWTIEKGHTGGILSSNLHKASPLSNNNIEALSEGHGSKPNVKPMVVEPATPANMVGHGSSRIVTAKLSETAELVSSAAMPIQSLSISISKSTHDHGGHNNNQNDKSTDAFTKMLVVGGRKGYDYSWIKEQLPEWESMVYYPDDVHAPHHLIINKGREPALYLSYIIENYDELRDLTVFVHANRSSWHNDFGLHRNVSDLVVGLQNLRTGYVLSQKYVNLRCRLHPGCDPIELPLNDTTDDRTSLEAFRKAYLHLHPGPKLPDQIGSRCCAQFAVAREKILARPKVDYERYYMWLMAVDETEWNAGWIFEYTWHIIFGKLSVDCGMSADDCSCNVFGFCKSGKRPK